MVDLSGILPVVGSAFADWLKLFIAPLRNLDMLWIIVPVWGVWLFSEFYQEKKGTSFGNAIANGATMLFVGVDWTRHVISDVTSGELAFGFKFVTLAAIAAAVLIYGVAIIILGIKANRLVRVIGRVRETTYFMVMLSPVIYGVEEFSLRSALVMLTFFPVFYVLVEAIDRLLPTPRIFEEEEGAGFDKELGIGNTSEPALGSDFGQDVFGRQQQPPQQQWRQQAYPAYPSGFQQFKPQQPQRKL
ncbi:hypothetical protein HYU40_04590 [Candidatus Woesearchaeota archaeon]|nr:hypothetical protein [Candidatus Woesearchaeota archaeon]